MPFSNGKKSSNEHFSEKQYSPEALLRQGLDFKELFMFEEVKDELAADGFIKCTWRQHFPLSF